MILVIKIKITADPMAAGESVITFASYYGTEREWYAKMVATGS
jgi:hypothetical protein